MIDRWSDGVKISDEIFGQELNAQPGYVVGNWIDFNRAFDGDIAEIIVYDRALSDGTDDPSDNELGAIHFYLQEKYGLDLDIEIENENSTQITTDISDRMLGLLFFSAQRSRRSTRPKPQVRLATESSAGWIARYGGFGSDTRIDRYQ